jgi:hypothetical protein
MPSLSRPRDPQGFNFVINTSTAETENNDPFISVRGGASTRGRNTGMKITCKECPKKKKRIMERMGNQINE